MKKAFFTCLTGMLLTWTMTSVSYSQIPNGTAKLESSHEEVISSPEEINAGKHPNPIVPGEISAKAVKRFTKDYRNVSNAKWFNLDKGFVVYFTIDDVKSRVFYTKRGHCDGTIRDYSEDKLPREIRHLVKSTYYDFSITHVNEVTVNGITAFLVHMKDKTCWKTIKVVDGEMEVVEEFLQS